MIQIKFNGERINVPENWAELNTKEYLALVNLIQLFTDPATGTLNENIDEVQLQHRIVESILGIPRDKCEDILFEDYTKINHALSFLTSSQPEPNKFIQKDKFEIGKYLLKVKQFDKLTIGEYADIQHLNENKDQLKAMACLTDCYEKGFMRKDKKVDIDLDEKVKLIERISCLDYQNLCFFLHNGMCRFDKTTARSLNRQAIRVNMSVFFQSLGAIIVGCKTWLWKTLTRSNKQHN